jgi:hypothetical protein
MKKNEPLSRQSRKSRIELLVRGRAKYFFFYFFDFFDFAVKNASSRKSKKGGQKGALA